METSLFKQYVSKWFGPIITKIIEKINGSTDQPTYLHKQMLKKKYSTSMKWASLSSNGQIVAADVVSMNSSLPLKKRDSIERADGDIPKLGMKTYLDEQTMSDLDIMEAQNSNGDRTKSIIQKVFGDTNRCLSGVYEQLEKLFLEALSTGFATTSENDETGTAIRVDFGYKNDNRFGAEVKWSEANAKPVDDIERILEKAGQDGNTPKYMMMDRAAFKNLAKSDQFKQLYAASLNFSGSNIPTPTLKQANATMDENYDGLQIVIVNRSVTLEKNGKRKTIKPWAANTVVFLNSMQVGDLTWARLAEMNRPVKQVDYITADEFILMAKYHKNDPLREFTSSQAIALPVINAVDEIYVLNSEEADADDEQTEGDAVYTYKGTDYTKQSVVDGLNATDEVPEATIDQADSTLTGKINKLSDEGVAVFETELVESV